jgi:uncharacterized Zn-finger protein
MNDAMGTGQAINVSPDQATVCCRGASNALGHPVVYLAFAENSTVRCYYCGCEYKQTLTASDNPQKAG